MGEDQSQLTLAFTQSLTTVDLIINYETSIWIDWYAFDVFGELLILFTVLTVLRSLSLCFDELAHTFAWVRGLYKFELTVTDKWLWYSWVTIEPILSLYYVCMQSPDKLLPF